MIQNNTSECTTPPLSLLPRLRADEILSSISDGLCVLDWSWGIVQANDALLARLGESSETLIGANWWRRFPSLIGSEFEREVRRAVTQRVPTRVRMPREWLGGGAEVRVHPFQEGVVLLWVDVLESANERSERERHERLLQTLIDATPAFLSYVDRNCRYRIVSKHYEECFKRPRDQIVGRSMREIVGEFAWEQLAPKMEQALQGEQVSFQVRVEAPGRGARWSEGTYTPDFDPSGNVRGVIVLVNDVTEQKNYERELQDKEASYNSIFESPGVSNIEADMMTGRILKVNRLSCEMLGYSEEELLDGLTFLDITYPGDRERDRALVAPLLKGEVDHVRLEKRYLRKDGTPVWVSVAVTVLRDPNGTPYRVLGAAQDISLRIEAERALRESEERVRLAVKAAGVGYWSRDVQTGRGVLDETCAKLFHVGLVSNDEEIFSRIIVEDRERVQEAFYNSFHGEQPFHAEFRVRDPDGSVRWLVGLGGVARDSTGTLLKLHGVNIDISARKYAEEERHRFVSLVKNSSEFIAMCDRSGEIFFMNDAALQMVGSHGLHEIPRVPLWSFLDTEGSSVLRSHFSFVGDISKTAEVETQVRNALTGEVRWVALSIFPVLDTDAQPAAVAAVGRDVTDRKRAEEILTEADKRKDEFLATLAHELRNPLAPISNALQVWPRVERDAEQTQKIRAMMDRQVKQLKHLIDDLLDVSRISRGKIQLRPERVEVGDILESAIESARAFIDHCGHDLCVDIPTTPVILHGDRGRLTQIIGNLVHNAAKYSPNPGRIAVSARVVDGFAEVSVRDTGAGIPLDMLERIFEPFTQIDRTLHRSQGGLGIGLTLVRNLVELHGGVVIAKSGGIGRGSEFLVRLPLAGVPLEDDSESTAVTREDDATPARLPRRRVLVVDDLMASAETLAMMLEELNQDVRIAGDGAAALDLSASYHPEIVLSDIAMPGMDGYELAKRMRAIDGPPHSLIALTGYGQEYDRGRSHAAGFARHLVKPTTLEALREALEAIGCQDVGRPVIVAVN